MDCDLTFYFIYFSSEDDCSLMLFCIPTSCRFPVCYQTTRLPSELSESPSVTLKASVICDAKKQVEISMVIGYREIHEI